MTSVRHWCCWLFGCRGDIADQPCERCGKPVSYSDAVEDTRWHRIKLRVTFFLPDWSKCPDCGKRWGKHDDCIPF